MFKWLGKNYIKFMVAALLVLVTFLLHLKAPDGQVDVHTIALSNLFYIPILIAAISLRRVGGVITALIATICLNSTSHTTTIDGWWYSVGIEGAFFLLLAYLAGLLASRLQDDAREWHSLQEINRSINSSLDLEKTQQAITKLSVELTSADACAIRLVINDGNEMVYGETCGLSDAYIAKGPMLLHQSANMRRSLRGEEVCIVDVRKVSQQELPYRDRMLAEGIISVLSLPLKVDDEVIGLLNLYRKRFQGFSSRDRRVGRAFAEQAAIAIKNARLYDSIQKNYLETVRALTRAIEARDPVTLGHSERVTDIAMKMGHALQLSAAEMQTLEFGAMLHDIGKIGLDENLFTKPGNYSVSEQMLMEMHPIIGRSIVEPVEFLRNCMPIIFSHHENWDGSGYPEGLEGTNIPVVARIVAVVDRYDHIAYASAFPISHAEALEEVRKEAGIQLDPHIVDMLVEVIVQEFNHDNVSEVKREVPVNRVNYTRLPAF
ncbi:MAG: HD domain-containing phosphohydrolase [bacterium]